MNHGDIQLVGRPRPRLSGTALVLGVLLIGAAGFLVFGLGSNGGGARIETAPVAEDAAPTSTAEVKPLAIKAPDTDDVGALTNTSTDDGPLEVQIDDSTTTSQGSSSSSETSEIQEVREDESTSSTTGDTTTTTLNSTARNNTASSSSTSSTTSTNAPGESSATQPTAKTRKPAPTQSTTTTQQVTTTTTESTATDPSTTTTTTESTTTTTEPTTTESTTTTTEPTTTTTTTEPTTTTTEPTTTTTEPTTTTTEPTTTTTEPTTTTTTNDPPVNGPIVWVDSRAAGGGDGSEAAPFRTINAGILAVRAGETLMIKGGEYREFVNPGYRMPKGTASDRISMRNAPGERVVIRGRVILTTIEYWTISGINVTWDNERNDSSVQHMVMLKGGSNWEFRDAEVWGAKAYSAILIGDDPRNFALRNLYVHDTYPTNDTNQDHLIYCACGTGGGIIERNLLVGSANGRAVKLGTANNSGGATGNVTIRYNTMVDNRGPSNIQLNFNTSNITMERNLMVATKDYATNISTYQLSGSNNRASNNLGYDSPGVVENHGGIVNGGGNIYRNPQLDANYVPQDSQAKAFGHKAP